MSVPATSHYTPYLESHGTAAPMPRMRSQPSTRTHSLSSPCPLPPAPTDTTMRLPPITEFEQGPQSAKVYSQQRSPHSLFGTTSTPAGARVQLPPISTLFSEMASRGSTTPPFLKGYSLPPMNNYTKDVAMPAKPAPYPSMAVKVPYLGLPNRGPRDESLRNSMPPEVPSGGHLRHHPSPHHFSVNTGAAGHPYHRPAYSPTPEPRVRCVTPDLSTPGFEHRPEPIQFTARKRCASEAPVGGRIKRGPKNRPRFQFATNLTPEKCSTMMKAAECKKALSSEKPNNSISNSNSNASSGLASPVRGERQRTQSDSKLRRERRELTPPPISYAPSWRIPNLNVKIYTCESCGKKYKNAASLVKHRADHARQNAAESLASPSQV
ncbi:hypothetical protein H4R34_004032 [Dimargaris verticillata]|uniref:C2H2-type domain-containing protein n=1 Tax=Dimargaris verticillata TaxID=2761393 RepID=A0A9W8B539_9FUNG|nr:hypothetical protein H4R34_004032 [Dimargaris verticillata]